MNTLELRDKKAALKKEATEIIEAAKNEIRDLNEDEAKKVQEIKDEIIRLSKELEALEAKLSGEGGEDNKEEQKHKRKMEKQFNLLTAIRNIANNQELDAVSKAVINEGADEMRKAGISYQGQIQLPTESRSVTVTAEGDDVVGVDVTNILEPLRAKNVLVQAGAKYMTGLVGDVTIPVMQPSSVSWAGEVADASDANISFDGVKLSPKRLTCYVDISRQFLNQSLDAEAVIKADIVNAINTKLESTILGSEAGTTTRPAGLFYTDGTLDTISDFGDLTDLEADVEDTNVMGECKYIVSNKAKAALRTMAKGDNTSANVMENGEIDGTEVFNTSNVATNGIAYGDWSNLVIGQWGSLDIVCDPYTVAKQGAIRLIINAFLDCAVVRPGTIAVATV